MRIFLISLIVSFLTSFAWAVAPVNMEDITEIYLSTSPQIQSAKELHQLSRRDLWRRYLINEPQFQYLNQDNGSSEVFGLSLPIAFPGKTFALRHLDSAKEKFQEAEVIGKTFEAVKYVVQAYLDCAGAKQSLKNINATVGDLQTLYFSLAAMYESGHSTQAERIGAELQLRQARSDLHFNEDKAHINCEKLAKIVGTSSDELTALPIPEDLPSSILNKLDTHTADHVRAQSAIDLAQTNMDIATWSQIPDLNLSYNRNHYIRDTASPSGEPWTTTYGVSITIPIFFPFHERTEIRRTKAQALGDQFAAQIQLQQADLDEADAFKEYMRSTARLKELQTRDLTLGETLVESTFSAYKSGKLGFAELMSSRKTLADLKNQELQLKISIINAHLRCPNKCSL